MRSAVQLLDQAVAELCQFLGGAEDARVVRFVVLEGFGFADEAEWLQAYTGLAPERVNPPFAPKLAYWWRTGDFQGHDAAYFMRLLAGQLHANGGTDVRWFLEDDAPGRVSEQSTWDIGIGYSKSVAPGAIHALTREFGLPSEPLWAQRLASARYSTAWGEMELRYHSVRAMRAGARGVTFYEDIEVLLHYEPWESTLGSQALERLTALARGHQIGQVMPSPVAASQRVRL